MRRWMITLTMMYGIVQAQNNNFKQYLADNKATLNLTGNGNWDLLKQDAAQNQLIIVGESHGAQNAQWIDFSLLKYLNKNFGITTYIAELDYAQATLLNDYLTTGDERKLKIVFRNWVRSHAQWGNYDFYNKIVKIRALNKTLAKDRKIHFVGIDLVQDFGEYLKLITHFSENRSNPLLDTLQAEIKKAAQDSDFDRITLFAQNYLQTIQQNESDFKNLLKTDFPIFEYLFQNLSYSSNTSGVKRPEGIYRNYKQLYDILHWENQKLYGMWGFFHAHLTPFYFVGDDFVSKLANSDHPTSKKIMSIICFPIESKYNVWDAQHNSWMKQPFSYNDPSLLNIDGIQDLVELTDENTTTLFKLNGTNSPFLKNGRLVNGMSPQGKLMANFKTQDYANQYVILMRNSDWLHPLPDTF
jgi:hypothetical protein